MSRIRYHHIHEGTSDGGATVAVDREAKVIAIASCSPKDAYCKRVGREKALARLRDPQPREWIVYLPALGKKRKTQVQRANIIRALERVIVPEWY
jgi:hypothetical protein